MSLPFAGAEPPEQTRVFPVPDASHIGEARRGVATLSSQLGWDESASGKVAIVATELATNLANHGGGGQLLARAMPGGTGVELIAVDKGRGIADVERAMRDGYSSGGTAGQGLGAVARMSDVFDLYSQPGRGTVALSRMLRQRPESSRSAADHLDVGVVNVAAPGEVLSGDAWVIVDGQQGAAVVIIDGLGHGPQAHEAATLGLSICRAQAGSPPGALIEAMHPALRSTRGAAAAVAEIDEAAACVRYSGLGNIACSIVSTEGSRSLASMSGIVGHEARKVQEFTAPFPPGATLVMFSDGLTSRWRLDDYPGVRPRHPSVAAALAFRDHLRGRDDATVVVARLRAPKSNG